MRRSKNPHPRIETRQGPTSFKGPQSGPWVPMREADEGWMPVYAEVKPSPLSECNGQYVIENPKVDEILKVTVWKGRAKAVRLRWIREDGPKAIGEEPVDKGATAHRLLLEDGTVLAGIYRFRTRRTPASMNKTSQP